MTIIMGLLIWTLASMVDLIFLLLMASQSENLALYGEWRKRLDAHNPFVVFPSYLSERGAAAFFGLKPCYNKN